MSRFTIYSPYSKWKETDIPNNAHVNLAVGTCSLERDHILVSPNLMTEEEIDYAVNAMKDELEMMRKKAKVELKKQNERIRAAVDARMAARNL